MDGAGASDLYRTVGAVHARKGPMPRRVGGPLRWAQKPWARAWVEPPRVQILVVVANIQTRTLKAEVEKGSTWTAVERGSVDPKEQAKAVPKRGGESEPPPHIRKGIGSRFPNLDVEIVLFGGHRRWRKRTRRRWLEPREEFSFLVEARLPWNRFARR